MANINAVLLTGPLTGRGTAAQLTPAAYATNQSVVGAVWATNLWMVSNYYGKFSVTPEGGSGAWYVNSAGRLSRTNPAELAAARAQQQSAQAAQYGGHTIHYSPQIYAPGGDPNVINGLLKLSKREFEAMLERYFADKARRAY